MKTKRYDVGGFLKGLFGGEKEDKFSELESVGGPGRRARTVEEQIGRRAPPKEEVKTEKVEETSKPSGRTSFVEEANIDYKSKEPEPSRAPAVVKKAAKVAEPKSKPYPEETRAKAKVGAAYEDVTKALREEEEKKKEKERKRGQGLTPYEKGRSFTGSVEDWGSMIKKAREAKEYKSGGKVSSASKRADGIAMRGKTKGRIY